MKVAIIHYWLVTMRGGERFLEQMSTLYPQADIFTHVFDPSQVSDQLKRHRIQTTFINRLPQAHRHYQKYLPLMPMALEQLDLRGYDLVITSESGPAKGVITNPETLNICYCHSPMRYLWNMYHDYRETAGPLTRALMGPLFHYLRQWDYASAARVDHFLSNSSTVARRIEKFYRRPATVLSLGIDLSAFTPLPADQPRRDEDDFYLCCGQLVGYKRTDLAVQAFNRMKKKLVVIGTGEQMELLKQIAGPTITLLGSQPFSVLKDHYARCRALIFPGEEDYGLVPIEAMASGRPVIAYGRGGVLDTVVDGVTGLYFPEQSEQALVEAVTRFEQQEQSLSQQAILHHVQQFSQETFRQRFATFVEQKLEEHRQHTVPFWR